MDHDHEGARRVVRVLPILSTDIEQVDVRFSGTLLTVVLRHGDPATNEVSLYAALFDGCGWFSFREPDDVDPDLIEEAYDCILEIGEASGKRYAMYLDDRGCLEVGAQAISTTW